MSLPETISPEHHLEAADTLQIQLLLRVSPAQRLSTMLETQAVILNTWHRRLRKANPQLSDLELCRLMFERLQHKH